MDVEILPDETDAPAYIASDMQILDREGKPAENIPLLDILLAAVDAAGSVFRQSEWDTDEEEFIELVEGLLRVAVTEESTLETH